MQYDIINITLIMLRQLMVRLLAPARHLLPVISYRHDVVFITHVYATQRDIITDVDSQYCAMNAAEDTVARREKQADVTLLYV